MISRPRYVSVIVCRGAVPATSLPGRPFASYLAKQDQPVWRRKLQAAWAHPAYADAKRALDRLYHELRILNESAARRVSQKGSRKPSCSTG